MKDAICCSLPSKALGAWWVPASPSQQVAGSFAWDPDSGATLDLLGFFADGGDPADFTAPVVHGAAEQREYTLINCHTAQFNLRVPGIMTQQLRAFGGVLVSCNHPDPTADDFDRITLDIEHLAELASWSHVMQRNSSSDGETIDSWRSSTSTHMRWPRTCETSAWRSPLNGARAAVGSDMQN